MSEKPSVSFIVLCYRDGPALASLTARLSAVLTEHANEHEILIVDDGSNDGSELEAQRVADATPRTRAILHERNRGVGRTLASGYEQSCFPIIGYMDGDAQYAPEDIPVLLARLKNSDATSGVRVDRKDPAQRTVVSFFYKHLLWAAYGLRFRDVNSGLKLYKRSFLETASPWAASGAFFDAEIIIKAVKAGLKLEEIPISHFPRKFGVARGASRKSITSTLREVFSPRMRPYRRLQH